MKKIIYFSLAVIFSIILFYLSYNLILKHDGWVLGDWLINYEDGGFKRRGLVGTVFIFVYDKFNLDIAHQVFFLCALVWMLFFVFFSLQISKIKISVFGLVLLLFNTTSLLFNAVSTESIGRKEILLFNVFLFYTILYNVLSTKKRTLIFGLILFVISLIHELTFFYIGYFILFDWVVNKSYKINFFTAFIFILAVFIPAISFYLWGADINEGKSIEILQSKGVILSNGIFNHHENYNTLQHFNIYIKGYLKYSIPILISYASILYFIRLYGEKYRILLKIYSINLLFSVPLFYLATDWGRWLNIHMILILILAIYLMSNDNGTHLLINKKQKIKIIIFVIICVFIQTAVCCNGAKLNYFLEILLSKI